MFFSSVLVVASLACRVLLSRWETPFRNVEFHWGFVSDMLISTKLRNPTKPKYPKYELVTLYMEPCDSKKVPCTKYQNSYCRPENLENVHSVIFRCDSLFGFRCISRPPERLDVMQNHWRDPQHHCFAHYKKKGPRLQFSVIVEATFESFGSQNKTCVFVSDFDYM